MQPATTVQAQRDDDLTLEHHTHETKTGEDSAVSLTSGARSFPLVTAFAVGDGAVRFWCDPCRRWHEHGQVFERGEHRISHCWNPKSPFYRGSYCLDPVPATPEVLRAINSGRAPKLVDREAGRHRGTASDRG